MLRLQSDLAAWISINAIGPEAAFMLPLIKLKLCEVEAAGGPCFWVFGEHGAYYGTRNEAQQQADALGAIGQTVLGTRIEPSDPAVTAARIEAEARMIREATERHNADVASRTLHNVRARVQLRDVFPASEQTIAYHEEGAAFAVECIDPDGVRVAAAWSPGDGDMMLVGAGTSPASRDGHAGNMTREQARALAQTLLRFADSGTKADA